eukprot:952198-Rhodomonas_salina.10
MAVFQIATGVEESWHPFRYSGIPLFDGATEESWIQSLAFGTQGGGLPFDALVQASTTQFVHRHCSMCLQAPASFLRFAPFNSEDSNATLSLRRGLAFNVENTHVAIGADGRRRLLGLERIYKQIRDGTVKLNLDGYLDIPGCYWPNTENIKWQIGFESEIIFHPFPSIVLFDRVSVSLGGIRQYEDIAHNFRAMLYLAENRPFEINARSDVKLAWRPASCFAIFGCQSLTTMMFEQHGFPTRRSGFRHRTTSWICKLDAVDPAFRGPVARVWKRSIQIRGAPIRGD